MRGGTEFDGDGTEAAGSKIARIRFSGWSAPGY
jgi:hypothetical protein